MSRRRRGNGEGSLFQRRPQGPWIASWYENGLRKEKSTGTTSRADAERIARKWVERAALISEGLARPEGGTELEQHASKSIESHLNAFTTAKQSEGRSVKHVDGTASMIRATASASGWKSLGQVNPGDLERVITARTNLKKGGWTPRTAHKCITAWRTFMRWCVSDSRLVADPLARLKKPAPHRVRHRRMLLIEEWKWLRSSIENAPSRFGMSGRERTVLYALAIETGLRAGELSELTRSHLLLDTEKPCVLLKASETKNKRAARQYIRPHLASLLADHTRHSLNGARIFAMPPSTKTALMFRADLHHAREEWIAAAGADPTERLRRESSDFLLPQDHDDRVLDFHSLRHTTGAWAAIGGASPKAIQTLMRHSTITMTLDTYGHLLPDEAANTVSMMPNLEESVMRLTGTDDRVIKSSQTARRAPAVHPAVAVQDREIQCIPVREQLALVLSETHEPVAESADAADLKSASRNGSEGSSPSGLIWVVHKETAQEGSRAVSILLSGEFLCLHCASKYV